MEFYRLCPEVPELYNGRSAEEENMPGAVIVSSACRQRCRDATQFFRESPMRKVQRTLLRQCRRSME